MTTFGLTDVGFVQKTFADTRSDLVAALQSAFGSSIDLGNKSIFGQIVAIFAERIALVWELAEVVNSSQDPDKATGAALDALCVLTGTFRPPATYTTVVVTLCGVPTTVVPAGKNINTVSTAKTFTTTSSGTITALASWAMTTVYVVGDRVTTGGFCYECTTAGTSGTVGLSGTGTGLSDGGTTFWSYIGTGTGAIDVIAVASVTGAISAVAGDLTSIQDAVIGWSTAYNLLDASQGRDVATDAELRVLRELELSSAGHTSIDEIIAALVDTNDVASANLFVNNTDTTDADGVPPHAIEALVRSTTDTYSAAFDQSIWDALLANVAAGIVTYGSQVGSALDSQGTSHVIKYSRPEAVPIYVVIYVTKDPALYPVDGDSQIKQAIIAWGDSQRISKDAVSSAVLAQAFSVTGVLEVTACYIGTSPAPVSSATIPISTRQLATYVTSRVSVTSVDGTP